MEERRLVRVRVLAGARKEKIVEREDGTYEIAVREKAERGEANERICKLVAVRLAVPRKSIRILTGHHRNNKTLEIVE